MFIETPSGRERVAQWWCRKDGFDICRLCPHICRISIGEVGRCVVRRNFNGILITENYGRVCVRAIDTVEKKPIYHFKPGSRLLSIGTFGCNMRCENCQNYMVSQASRDEVESEFIGPAEIMEFAESAGVDGIAFTFNEPVIWLEYVMDVAREARSGGRSFFMVLNTNGYISREASEDILPFIDAMNIDIKGFSDDFYRKNCGANLEPVLDTCIEAVNKGIHVELTYLLIPGKNDSEYELNKFFRWVIEKLGPNIPLHLYRFHPFYKLSDIPPQTLEHMERIYQCARRTGLKYVYFGGVTNHERQNTYCPICGHILVRRKSGKEPSKICMKDEELSRFCPGYSEIEKFLDDGRCPECGEKIHIVE